MALYSKLVSALKALVMNALEPAPSALSRQDFSQSDPSTSPTLLQDADKQGQDYAPHSEPKSELPITGDEAQDPALVRKRKVLTYIFGFLILHSVLPLVLSLVMGQLYAHIDANASKAAVVRSLRYVVPPCELETRNDTHFVDLSLRAWACLSCWPCSGCVSGHASFRASADFLCSWSLRSRSSWYVLRLPPIRSPV